MCYQLAQSLFISFTPSAQILEALFKRKCKAAPGGWGDNRMGVCGRLVRPQSPIPLFPLYVPSWTPGRPDGHSLSPAALGWHSGHAGLLLWETKPGAQRRTPGYSSHRPSERQHGADVIIPVITFCKSRYIHSLLAVRVRWINC